MRLQPFDCSSAAQEVLVTATDELVLRRMVKAATLAALAEHYSRPQIAEFSILATQYDAAAAASTAVTETRAG